MGRRGPAPTPTAQLKLRGSWRAKDPKRKNEPEAEIGVPARPPWLVGEAAEAWEYLAPRLLHAGCIAYVDVHAFARYCHTWARWRACVDFISKHGETYTIRDNNARIRGFASWPQSVLANKLAAQLTRLEQEFGLTPAARARISTDAAIGRAHEDGTKDKRRFFGA